MTAIPRAALVLTLLLGAALGSGCVYRPNIQQGNLLEVKDVDQVQAGMTRSQVRYLLGTPMIADPFDPQRWDYIYTFRRGRERTADRAHFVVRFDGDRVSQVEKLDLPERPLATQVQQQKPKRRKGGNGEAAVEEAVKPDTPPLEDIIPESPRPGDEG